MNRANDKHFFECWDLAQSLQEQMPVARAKQLEELLALEEELYNEAGFYADYTYQEAIEAYREHTSNAH